MNITKLKKVNIEIEEKDLAVILSSLRHALVHDRDERTRDLIMKIQQAYPEWVENIAAANSFCQYFTDEENQVQMKYFNDLIKRLWSRAQ
jgi:hypothetical protein